MNETLLSYILSPFFLSISDICGHFQTGHKEDYIPVFSNSIFLHFPPMEPYTKDGCVCLHQSILWLFCHPYHPHKLCLSCFTNHDIHRILRVSTNLISCVSLALLLAIFQWQSGTPRMDSTQSLESILGSELRSSAWQAMALTTWLPFALIQHGVSWQINVYPIHWEIILFF